MLPIHMNLMPNMEKIADYITDALNVDIVVKLNGERVIAARTYIDSVGYTTLVLEMDENASYSEYECTLVSEITKDYIILDEHEDRPLQEGYDQLDYVTKLTFHRQALEQINLMDVDTAMEPESVCR